MPDLQLARWDCDRTRPLMDGRVKPEGIDLDIEYCVHGGRSGACWTTRNSTCVRARVE